MKRFAYLFAFGCLALSRTARAQGVDEFGAFGRAPRERRESPQNGAFEARFGPYTPRVDQSVNGTPFADTFGNSKRYLFGLEGDWQALRIPHLGSLGPGLGWGYTRATGRARLTAQPDVLSDEQTALTVMPFYLIAVLRADVLPRELHVPFVPYAKLGVGYALWWASDGGNTASLNGVQGKGVSYGYQFALGGMLLLDFLDQQTARDADNSLGINHSYLFGEWYGSELDAFGSKKRMNVGANTWVLGFAIEF